MKETSFTYNLNFPTTTGVFRFPCNVYHLFDKLEIRTSYYLQHNNGAVAFPTTIKGVVGHWDELNLDIFTLADTTTTQVVDGGDHITNWSRPFKKNTIDYSPSTSYMNNTITIRITHLDNSLIDPAEYDEGFLKLQFRFIQS